MVAVPPDRSTFASGLPASTLWYVVVPSNGRLLTIGSTYTMTSIGPPSRSPLNTRTLAGSVPKRVPPLPHEASRTAANAYARTLRMAARVCVRRVRLMDEKRRNGPIAAGSLYLQSRGIHAGSARRARLRGGRGKFETIGYELRKVC